MTSISLEYLKPFNCVQRFIIINYDLSLEIMHLFANHLY